MAERSSFSETCCLLDSACPACSPSHSPVTDSGNKDFETDQKNDSVKNTEFDHIIQEKVACKSELKCCLQEVYREEVNPSVQIKDGKCKQGVICCEIRPTLTQGPCNLDNNCLESKAADDIKKSQMESESFDKGGCNEQFCRDHHKVSLSENHEKGCCCKYQAKKDDLKIVFCSSSVESCHTEQKWRNTSPNADCCNVESNHNSKSNNQNPSCSSDESPCCPNLKGRSQQCGKNVDNTLKKDHVMAIPETDAVNYESRESPKLVCSKYCCEKEGYNKIIRTDDDSFVMIDIAMIDRVCTTKLRIQNICCGKEAVMLKQELEPRSGIESVSVNIVGRLAFIKHKPDIISVSDIVSVLNKLHLGVSVMETGHNDDNDPMESIYIKKVMLKGAMMVILLIMFIVLIISHVHEKKWQKWIAIAEIIFGGFPILRKTILNWRKRIFIDIYILMLIAVIGTVVLEEWIEGATVVFVFSIAEVLQQYCGYKVQKTISGLMVRMPNVAVLAESSKTVPVEDVEVGTHIVVCAGEKIPLDGFVVKGQASVDESSITGESVPIEKNEEDSVYSGTIVQNGYLEIKTTSDASSSTVSKVSQLVQEAQSKSSHTEQLMNKFAQIYTPLVLVVALLVFTIPAILGAAGVNQYADQLHQWGMKALIVLLIACPCALIMSAPMPMVCGITTAARNGVLVKGGTHLEAMCKVKTVAFDKTGTLTEGRFRVVNVKEIEKSEVNSQDALRMAAALEVKSSHPVAAGIVNHYSGCITEKIANLGTGVGLPDVTNFKSISGLGVLGRVEGRLVGVGNLKMLEDFDIDVGKEIEDLYSDWSEDGHTVVFVVINNKLTLVISLADTPRSTASTALKFLADLNIDTIILTGDSTGAASAVKRSVGVENFIASMKPEDKLKWIRTQQKSTKSKCTVAMVGDGVNDGPSLAAANVGIAIGACGTALAIESAGVALMSDNLVKIPELVFLSRFTSKIILENIILAILIKIAVVVATLAGKMVLWMAVVADVAALLLVIMNGLRPLFWIPRDCNLDKVVNDAEEEPNIGDQKVLSSPLLKVT